MCRSGLARGSKTVEQMSSYKQELVDSCHNWHLYNPKVQTREPSETVQEDISLRTGGTKDAAKFKAEGLEAFWVIPSVR